MTLFQVSSLEASPSSAIPLPFEKVDSEKEELKQRIKVLEKNWKMTREELAGEQMDSQSLRTELLLVIDANRVMRHKLDAMGKHEKVVTQDLQRRIHSLLKQNGKRYSAPELGKEAQAFLNIF